LKYLPVVLTKLSLLGLSYQNDSFNSLTCSTPLVNKPTSVLSTLEKAALLCSQSGNGYFTAIYLLCQL